VVGLNNIVLEQEGDSLTAFVYGVTLDRVQERHQARLGPVRSKTVRSYGQAGSGT
jgi:hypothetical protein